MGIVPFVVFIAFIAASVASFLESEVAARRDADRRRQKHAMIRRILYMRILLAEREVARAERAVRAAREYLHGKLEEPRDE